MLVSSLDWEKLRQVKIAGGLPTIRREKSAFVINNRRTKWGLQPVRKLNV
jgi:hypothetical protein